MSKTRLSRELKSKFRALHEVIGEANEQHNEHKLLPENKAEWRRFESRRNPQFFYKTYLRDYFKCDPAPYHLELPELFSKSNFNKPVVVLAPRGGAKTTFLFGETLRLLVTGQQKFIVRVEASEKIANKEIFKIRREIENNQQLIADFGELQSQPWSASELFFKNECMLWGRGRQQPVRGVTYKEWRPTGIIYNDVETQQQVYNQTVTDKIFEALYTEALPALNPKTAGGGFLAVVGTLLGRESMLAKLRNRRFVKKIEYPALIGDDQVINVLLDKLTQDEEEIEDYLSQFDTDDDYDSQDESEMEKQARLELRRQFFYDREDYMELISQLQSFWPDRFPVTEILLSAVGMPLAAFKQEYLHIPVDSTITGAFNREWFFRDENMYSIDELPQENLVRATFLDPSYKDSTTSDHKAFITGFYDIETGVGYIIDVTAGRMSYDEMIETAFRVANMCLRGDVTIQGRTFPNSAFVNTMFGWEDNMAQQFLGPIFTKAAETYGFELPRLTGVTHMGNKIARINQLAYYVQRAKIRMDLDSQEQLVLINELCSLGNRKVKDDRADALEGWWSMVEKVRSNVIMIAHDVGNFQFARRSQTTFRDPIYANHHDRQRYNPKYVSSTRMF